ncbi:MAG: thioredoxin domain-containing protein [Patescibacteria group bacterium]
MTKEFKNGIILVIGLVTAAALLYFFIYAIQRPGQYDEFAKCLKEKNVIFYGAFWCPHCQDQKKAFGSSAKYLPYVECSTADSRNQLQVCKDAGIKAYPTWKFADGSVAEGDLTLEKLAEKTGCALP